MLLLSAASRTRDARASSPSLFQACWACIEDTLPGLVSDVSVCVIDTPGGIACSGIVVCKSCGSWVLSVTLVLTNAYYYEIRAVLNFPGGKVLGKVPSINSPSWCFCNNLSHLNTATIVTMIDSSIHIVRLSCLYLSLRGLIMYT